MKVEHLPLVPKLQLGNTPAKEAPASTHQTATDPFQSYLLHLVFMMGFYADWVGAKPELCRQMRSQAGAWERGVLELGNGGKTESLSLTPAKRNLQRGP